MRVKRLELDFTPLMTMNQCYTFTHKRFTRIINSIGDFLTSLTLMCVNVTGKLLDHCLSNCPVLERSHVEHSLSLVRLKIYSLSLQLKYLHILNYSQIKSIEIFAPNLEYFGFVGSRIELSVNYAPHLLDVLVGGIYFSPMSYLFCPLSSYLSQLQCLKLDICHCNYVSTLNSFAISFMYVYSVLCNVIFISSLLFFRVNWNTLN